MNKVAFDLGGFPIYWYGVFVATGFLAGLWTAARRAQRAGFSAESVVDLGPWLVVGALVGSRLLYVISYWNEQFADRPLQEIFMIRQGGMVYYGGFIGAVLLGILYVRRKGLSVWNTADIMAPSIALGQAFGRLGCLMNGCCYGRSCELPWAIHFPKDHASFGTGVHPTQIYESSLCLALSFALAWWYPRRRFSGQIFVGYLLGYALLRFLVECFRGDYPQRYGGGWLTPAQLVSFAILAAGLGLAWRLKPRTQA